MKKCFKCLIVKPLTEFYKHKSMRDGHLNKCKHCTKKDVHSHRLENIEKVRAYDRNRPNKEHRAAKQTEYSKTERGKQVKKLSCENYIRDNPLRYKATNSVRNAIRGNRLFRPSRCEQCQVECKPQGHHDDYLKPLEVRWLCVKCHSDFHKQAREILRSDGIVTGYMLVK